MKRILSNLAALTAAALIVLTVGVCFVWARSYRLSEQLAWTRSDGFRSVRSAHGQLVVHMQLVNWSTRRANEFGVRYVRDASSGPWEMFAGLERCYDPSERLVQWQRAGFGWSRRQSNSDLIATAVAPFWSVAAITVAMPAGLIAARLRPRFTSRRRGFAVLPLRL